MVLTAIGCFAAYRLTLFSWSSSGKPLGPNARLALTLLYGAIWLVVTGNFLYLFYPDWVWTFVVTALPGWAALYLGRQAWARLRPSATPEGTGTRLPESQARPRQS
jgi:hypothetical protein